MPITMLSEEYDKISLNNEIISMFAKKVGVQTQLEIITQSTNNHKMKKNLQKDYYLSRTNSSSVDIDWMLPYCEKVLQNITMEASQFIWMKLYETTLETLKSDDILKAYYRPNRNCQLQEAPSSIVLLLKENAWIPQKKDKELKFAYPKNASFELLPSGFPYNKDDNWLKAIDFGKEEELVSKEHLEKEAMAKKIGFLSLDTLERAKKFSQIPIDEQERLLSEYDRKNRIIQLPERESRNPERRQFIVAEQAIIASERTSEKRFVSVSNSQEVKIDVDEYLRSQYTNIDGEMICQICQKELPFKLDDGRYYFEKVELIPKDDFRQLHHENYIALCPNHSAMFKYANKSKESLKDAILSVKLKPTENKIPVILAKKEVCIHFTNMHLSDLKTVIEAMGKENDNTRK